MAGTAIGVQFNLNDDDESLAATYEVIGTSDNYSFQYNLGKGSDLAGVAGGEVQKSISLKGNYGDFVVRVFAVSDIGIRSEFLETGISISPPRLDGTFSFSDIDITNVPANVVPFQQVIELPSSSGGLTVLHEYYGKSVKIDWALSPPAGHAKEGQSLKEELLSDNLLSNFSITLKNGSEGSVVSSSSLNNSVGLQRFLDTSEVSSSLQNYTGFSLEISDVAFEELGVKRDFALEVVAHDYFGRTATGTISGSNPAPVPDSFTDSLNANLMTMSWTNTDIDAAETKIEYLSVPSGVTLYSGNSLSASISHLESLRDSSEWARHTNYRVGDKVYYEGEVYRCKLSYVYSENTHLNPLDNTYWESQGPRITFADYSENLSESSFSLLQDWGYCYYYTFQPSDVYGTGLTYNLTRGDAGSTSLYSPTGADDGYLAKYMSDVKIANLRFRERKDDLVFNWDILDQEGNSVDLNEFKFASDRREGGSILGISGSLFDSDNNAFLTGITEGGDTDIWRTPYISADNITSFEYTRALNNQIYGTGGWPTTTVWNAATTYSSGDHVVPLGGGLEVYLYRPWTEEAPPYSQPTWDIWSASGQASSAYSYKTTSPYSDLVLWDTNIYSATGDDPSGEGTLGWEVDPLSGIYNEFLDYSSGSIVISPDSDTVEIYSLSDEYSAGNFVLFSGSIYESNATHTQVFPNSSTGVDFWKIISPFSNDSFSASVYFCTGDNGPSAAVSLPCTGIDHWIGVDPSSDYLTGWTMVIPAYDLPGANLRGGHFDWSTEQDFVTGDFVVYNNNIWSGVKDSGPGTDVGVQVPAHGISTYWDAETGSDIISSNQVGDRVYYNDAVFICTSNDPTGAPFSAVEGTGESIASNHVDSQWFPLWTRMTGFSDKVFRHIGINESGKRDVGLELAIVRSDGQTISNQKIIGTNPEPSIMVNGFGVDSKSETTKVKFNFNYAFAMQEKTTKVELYRSSSPGFSILDAEGFAGADAPTFVQSYLGAGEDTFGDNITQITDSPPIPRIEGEGDKVTGYYYKILPYDDFGSGDLYSVDNNYGADEQVLVYPKNYSTSNPDGLPGPVYQQSAGDLPGVVYNFAGDTAFENYFLNWEVPFSGDDSLVGGHLDLQLLDKRANNISHYEVWQSHQDFLDLGSLGIHLTQEVNTGGYRRIIGDIADTGPIPVELQDPASGITNATNIFNVDARSPRLQATYRGTTNDKRYFWVRAVDLGGNKGPFTGVDPSAGEDIQGLGLILGQAATTDIAHFEQNITEAFPNTAALVPNNPFSNNTPTSTEVSWSRHFLYQDGVGYVIGPGDTDDSYVYWSPTGQTPTHDTNVTALTADQREELGLTGAGGGPLDNDVSNPLRNINYSGTYDTSPYHPAGEGQEGGDGGGGEFERDNLLGENDIIIARNSDGIAVPMWHVFANASIGTAHIQEAAITNAKIHNLTADKIRSAVIHGQDLQIGGAGSGQVRSYDFGVQVDHGFDGINDAGQGFAISGDGSFVFKGQDGKLFLENDTLTIHGKLRQSDGTELTLLAVRAEPNVFDYNELADSTFTPDPSNQTSNVFARFQNSDVGASDVRFKMERGNDGHEVFSYADYPGLAVGISGFSYNTSDFNTSTKEALALFNVTGFDSIISGGIGVNSVVVYASGIGTSTEHSATIYINSDGRQGETGRSPLFRGAWKPATQYSGAYSADGLTPKLRGDVVYKVDSIDPDSNYWICLKDHVSDASALNFSVDHGLGYWDSFGAEFDSVATDLLLSKDVIITDTLTMGTYDPDNIHQGAGGTIKSAGITWSSSDIYPTNIHGGDPSGFILTNDGGNPKFWIGSGSHSYLSYDATGQKVKMAGAFINNTVIDGNLDDTITGLAANNSDPLAIFIGGGYNNDIRMIDGGYGYDSVASSIVGGASGMIQGRFSFIGNGFNNQCFDNFSAIVGGYSNSMPIATSDNAGGNLIGCGTSGVIAGGSNDSIVGGLTNLIASGDESAVLAGISCKITKPHDPGIGLDIFTNIDSDGESMGRYDTSNYFFAPRIWGKTMDNGFPMDFSSSANKWLYSMFPGSGTSVGGFDGWFYANPVASVFGKFDQTLDGDIDFYTSWVFHINMGWMYLPPSQFTGQLYSHGEFEGNWAYTDAPSTLSASWWFFFKDQIYDGTLRSDSAFSSVPAGYTADKGIMAWHDGDSTLYPLICHPSTPSLVKYWNGAAWASW